ncbi:MAG: hypothetical protein KAY24_09830, partial [Candidatus Eisenbacteria sp.]|nr:hypothetical protein [Candidatus Eisenbacteria bacterium]
MIGVDLFGKQRVIGETFCACASESGPSLRMPDGNLVCGTARILYSAGRGEVRALAIYTVEGRRIRDLLSGQTSHANSGEILWDGRDQSGSRVPGGVYWMRLSTSEADQITRLVVIR